MYFPVSIDNSSENCSRSFGNYLTGVRNAGGGRKVSEALREVGINRRKFFRCTF